jgi:hypothetical protein
MVLDLVLAPIRGITKSFFSLFDISASVDVTTDIRYQVEPLINQMFYKLDSFTSDLKYAADELLVKSKYMADDLIKTTFNRLSALLEEFENIVNNILKTVEEFTPENIKNKLVEPFFKKVDELRINFINDLRTLINDTVIQVVDGVEKIMYKGDLILTGTVSTFRKELLKYVDSLPRFSLNFKNRAAIEQENKRCEECKKELNIAGIPTFRLQDVELYKFYQCRNLKRLNENVQIENIKSVYADLQNEAWNLACVGRNKGSALQDIAINDWLKYGQKYQLWNQFSG